MHNLNQHFQKGVYQQPHKQKKPSLSVPKQSPQTLTVNIRASFGQQTLQPFYPASQHKQLLPGQLINNNTSASFGQQTSQPFSPASQHKQLLPGQLINNNTSASFGQQILQPFYPASQHKQLLPGQLINNNTPASFGQQTLQPFSPASQHKQLLPGQLINNNTPASFGQLTLQPFSPASPHKQCPQPLNANRSSDYGNFFPGEFINNIQATKTNFQEKTLDETDAERISHMVLSAKKGEWERVWEVLDNKPHLVNCIPSERAWSVLHQAVWHNNVQAVVRILSYPACDTEIRTKQDRKCKSGPGMIPIDLAKSQQMKDILQSYRGTDMKSDEAPTMLPVDKMLYALGSCIHMTLSCNQGVLIPPKWPIEDHNTVHSIPYIMQAIFSHIDVADNWVKTKAKVSLTLQQYSKALGEKLWGESESTEDTKHQFFGRIIRLYTEDLRKICSVVNQMLRLQDTSISEYQPTSLELSLCPYALLLNSILLHWNELKGYTGITYRSCCLTKEQASEYVKGQQFVWLGFSSSSKQQGAFIAANYSHKASTYDFIIDNGKYNHKWAPRGIARYSAFALEEECLYPFGAKFQVTDVICNKVYIRLVDY